MGAPWSDDLTYGYYRRIVGALQARFAPVLLRDAPKRPASDKPHVILRHDVDVCPEAALRMARLEHEMGMRATYLLLVNSPLYSVEAPRTRAIAGELRELGHEVALHFDLEEDLRAAGCSPAAAERQIAAAAERLADATGDAVRSVSFHRPIEQFLRGPLHVAGLVNAYAAELMAWYLSDSNARWRQGEPLAQLAEPRHPVLQMLVHPIWWGEVHMACEDRLEAYHGEQLAARPGLSAEALDALLLRGIALRRRGCR